MVGDRNVLVDAHDSSPGEGSTDSSVEDTENEGNANIEFNYFVLHDKSFVRHNSDNNHRRLGLGCTLEFSVYIGWTDFFGQNFDFQKISVHICSFLRMCIMNIFGGQF